MAVVTAFRSKPVDAEVVERLRFTHTRRCERRHRCSIHGLDLPGGVEQDDSVGQGLERGFERVLGANDFADVRAPELGEIFGHLVERGGQLAELIMRRHIDALGEVSSADGVGAAASADAAAPLRCA